MSSKPTAPGHASLAVPPADKNAAAWRVSSERAKTSLRVLAQDNITQLIKDTGRVSLSDGVKYSYEAHGVYQNQLLISLNQLDHQFPTMLRTLAFFTYDPVNRRLSCIRTFTQPLRLWDLALSADRFVYSALRLEKQAVICELRSCSVQGGDERVLQSGGLPDATTAPAFHLIDGDLYYLHYDDSQKDQKNGRSGGVVLTLNRLDKNLHPVPLWQYTLKDGEFLPFNNFYSSAHAAGLLITNRKKSEILIYKQGHTQTYTFDRGLSKMIMSDAAAVVRSEAPSETAAPEPEQILSDGTVKALRSERGANVDLSRVQAVPGSDGRLWGIDQQWHLQKMQIDVQARRITITDFPFFAEQVYPLSASKLLVFTTSKPDFAQVQMVGAQP